MTVVDNTISGSVTTSTINYIVADQLNTPRAVSNSAGTVIWTWTYAGNPFGEQPPTSATVYMLNLRYLGQYYDAETRTSYNIFRTYEPATGRYLQSDPIGLNGGVSTYAYVAGDPLNWSDHTGQSPDVPPGQLPMPPTIVSAETGLLPDVPTIVIDPDQLGTWSQSNPQQQPSAPNTGACTSMEHAGIATGTLGGVIFLGGTVADAGVITAPAGLTANGVGGIGMAVGLVISGVGDMGIGLGLCH